MLNFGENKIIYWLLIGLEENIKIILKVCKLDCFFRMIRFCLGMYVVLFVFIYDFFWINYLFVLVGSWEFVFVYVIFLVGVVYVIIWVCSKGNLL